MELPPAVGAKALKDCQVVETRNPFHSVTAEFSGVKNSVAVRSDGDRILGGRVSGEDSSRAYVHQKIRNFTQIGTIGDDRISRDDVWRDG